MLSWLPSIIIAAALDEVAGDVSLGIGPVLLAEPDGSDVGTADDWDSEMLVDVTENDSETLLVAIAQNSCARFSAEGNWSAQPSAMHEMSEEVKFLLFLLKAVEG